MEAVPFSPEINQRGFAIKVLVVISIIALSPLSKFRKILILSSTP